MGNILSIIQLVVGLAPSIKAIYDAATSNSGVVDEIKKLSSPLATLLEEIGAKLFPKASPDIAIVGGIVAAFDPNTMKWVQGSINVLAKAWGWTDAPLVVDGLIGPKTQEAVEKVQIKLGLAKIDGLPGKITNAAIDAALASIPVTKVSL